MYDELDTWVALLIVTADRKWKLRNIFQLDMSRTSFISGAMSPCSMYEIE